jgi:hypothetical protein
VSPAIVSEHSVGQQLETTRTGRGAGHVTPDTLTSSDAYSMNIGVSDDYDDAISYHNHNSAS